MSSFRVSQQANGRVVINAEETRAGSTRQEADEVDQIKAQFRGFQEHIENVTRALGSDYLAVQRLKMDIQRIVNGSKGSQVSDSSYEKLERKVELIESQVSKFQEDLVQWRDMAKWLDDNLKAQERLKQVGDYIRTLEGDITDARSKVYGNPGSLTGLRSSTQLSSAGQWADSAVAIADGAVQLPRDFMEVSHSGLIRNQEDFENGGNTRRGAGVVRMSSSPGVPSQGREPSDVAFAPPQIRSGLEQFAHVGSNHERYNPGGGTPTTAALPNQDGAQSPPDPSADIALARPVYHTGASGGQRSAPATLTQSVNLSHIPGQPAESVVEKTVIYKTKPARSGWWFRSFRGLRRSGIHP